MNAEQLNKDLKQDEGLVLKPYRDSVGKLTIGIGRCLDDKGISEEEANCLFKNDVNSTSQELFSTFPWMTELNDVRQNVFLNMAFNMGVQGLAKFKLTLAYVQGGHYEMAAQEMLSSLWAKQVGARAIRLAKEMASGEFQNA